jgi:flavin-dependent dehydrogenase
MISAEMPACASAADAFGRVLGRDHLDELLLQRARTLGVTIHQPATVRRVGGGPGRYVSTLESGGALKLRRSYVLIDAHGSWERGPSSGESGAPPAAIVHLRRRASDLFGFKAIFRHSTLPAGLLPVLALPGGYGGMVLGDAGRTTLACCLRRDTLAACRAALPGASAGAAVEAFVRRSCPTVREMLESARRDGPWLSVGPLRPGIRLSSPDGALRVGNAAGESHPLIGEGISMALQSAFLAAAALTQHPARDSSGHRAAAAHRAYARAWRSAFEHRLKVAALYAHVAMRPGLAGPARSLLARWPSLLGRAARLAGKASPAPLSQLIPAEIR